MNLTKTIAVVVTLKLTPTQKNPFLKMLMNMVPRMLTSTKTVPPGVEFFRTQHYSGDFLHVTFRDDVKIEIH